jgi:hypothetical protein
MHLERLPEQGRRLAGERRVSTLQPLQVAAYLAELAHRGVNPLAGRDGEGAQLPQTGQGAPLLDRDRVGRECAFHRREVPRFLAECLGDAAGALVVQAGELRQELRGLRLLISDLALGVEPRLAEQGLGRRDLPETEDLRQGVVQLGGAPLQDPSQLVVREKGWPALQGTAPAVLLQVAPLAVDGEGGGRDVGFVRPVALMVMVVRPPSGRNLPVMRGGPWWRLRQPSCQTLARSVQRRFEPVSSISRASAKEDFPEPFRPTTRVRPGEGSRVSVAGGPMPRKPSTSRAAR